MWSASPTSTCRTCRRDLGGRHPQADDQGRPQAAEHGRRALGVLHANNTVLTMLDIQAQNKANVC
jgi:hypothetical protein